LPILRFASVVFATDEQTEGRPQGARHERKWIFHDVPNLSDPGRAQNGEISPQQTRTIGACTRGREILIANYESWL